MRFWHHFLEKLPCLHSAWKEITHTIHFVFGKLAPKVVWRAEHLKAFFLNLFDPIVKENQESKRFHWTGMVTKTNCTSSYFEIIRKALILHRFHHLKTECFFLFATLRDYKERFNSQLIDLQSSHFGCQIYLPSHAWSHHRKCPSSSHDRLAVAFSGGGVRAAFVATGVLWRLAVAWFSHAGEQESVLGDVCFGCDLWC